jgi:hypothetical protein
MGRRDEGMRERWVGFTSTTCLAAAKFSGEGGVEENNDLRKLNIADFVYDWGDPN